MVLLRSEKKFVEDQIKNLLQDYSLEDILEKFDLTAEEVLFNLYESGQLDPDVFESICV